LNNINTLVPIAVTFQSRYRTLKLAKPPKDLNILALDVLVQNVEPAGQVIHSSRQTDQRVLPLARLTIYACDTKASHRD
jgi:hypothetical protein